MLSKTDRTLNERDTTKWQATLLDENGSAVASADMTTLKMWLYDKKTGEIINSRNAQDILNTNNVTMHATSGLITWNIQAADNPILNKTIAIGDCERHIALIEAVWAGSTPGTKKHEIAIDVKNLRKVPTS